MTLYAGKESWGSNTALKLVRDGIAEAMGVDRGEHWNPKMTNDALMGYWHDPGDSVFSVSAEPEDDIDFLMLHQDCEGILPAFTVPRLAKRLRDILPKIPDDDYYRSFSAHKQAESLLRFLEQAADEGEMIVFYG